MSRYDKLQPFEREALDRLLALTPEQQKEALSELLSYLWSDEIASDLSTAIDNTTKE
jgi:hypothetical protein